jgi:hypothetical protein
MARRHGKELDPALQPVSRGQKGIGDTDHIRLVDRGDGADQQLPTHRNGDVPALRRSGQVGRGRLGQLPHRLRHLAQGDRTEASWRQPAPTPFGGRELFEIRSGKVPAEQPIADLPAVEAGQGDRDLLRRSVVVLAEPEASPLLQQRADRMGEEATQILELHRRRESRLRKRHQSEHGPERAAFRAGGAGAAPGGPIEAEGATGELR